MNRLRLIFLGSLLAFLAFMCGATRAQDQPQQPPPDTQQPPSDAPPKPAARSNPVPVIDTDQGDNPNQANQVEPDDTPLTGMLSAGLGTPEAQHSYWAAGLQFASSIQSSGFGSSGWYDYNYALGNFSLLEAWSHSKLLVNYSGGGYFSSGNGSGNGSAQQVSLAQNFTYNRLRFQIRDSFSYTPQSTFGFGGGTNLGIPGVGGSLGPGAPGIGTPYGPNVTLYAGLGPQYYNVGIIQGTYDLSSRSSLTASAGYGILDFINAGYVGTDSLYAGLGYNHILSPKDTIGILYQFGSYHFPGNPQAYGSQVASLAYSRKITGRLALTLYGGPQYTSYRVPIGTATAQLGAYASASLSYALENGGVSGSYVHSLSSGGGLLTGSILDQANLSASRKLSRVWTGNLNFGYARNNNVVSSSTVPNANYTSWYGGGGLSRQFTPAINFGVAYTGSISTYHLINCPGTTCGPNSSSFYQTVTVNVQWRTRPFVLR